MKPFTVVSDTVHKRLAVAEGRLVCTSAVDPATGAEYCTRPFAEFEFLADGKALTAVSVSRRGNTVTLAYPGGLAAEMRYETRPGAGLLQTLAFRNGGKRPVRLTDVSTGGFLCAPGKFAECRFFAGSDHREMPPCFCLDGTDDRLTCFNPARGEGWVAGSFVPGVLRYTLFFPHWGCARSGYSRSGAPFSRTLAPGEEWTCDPTFFACFRGGLDEADRVSAATARLGLPDPAPPGVMYCTWLPFLKDISEELVRELAPAAKAIGARYFVLDDGWFTGSDRAVDAAKFPHGLEKVSRIVHDAGLRFGLWYNIGTGYGLRRANEKFVCRNEDGSVKYGGGYPAFCFGSAYRQVIAAELRDLAERYAVDYFKLDFSAISSPYGMLPWGCHAHDHAFHRDFSDSVGAMYDGLHFISGELRQTFPKLVTDFSFEVFGPDRPTFAALRASPVHHVSNLSGNHPDFQSPLQIRRTFGRWFPGYPAERILGGLVTLHEATAEESFLTALAGAPLIAGDLRQLSPTTRAKLADHAARFDAAAARDPEMDFELLADEPDFDAFRRIGPSGHGFVCAFNRGDRARRIAGTAVPPQARVMRNF